MQQLGRLDHAHLLGAESWRQQLLDAIADIHITSVRNPDPNAAFERALQAFLLLTQSSMGFIGEVHVTPNGDPWLKTFAISDIAWDVESKALYEKYWRDGFEFRNLENLFGEVIRTGHLVISDNPSIDLRSRGVPTGHPQLTSFLGIPIHVDGRLIGMVGLANRIDGYSQALVDQMQTLIMVCGAMIESLMIRRERDRTTVLLKAAEQAQYEFAERNAAIIEAQPDYMFVLSAESVFLDFHCGNKNSLFVPPELFLGRHIADVMPPDICQKFQAASQYVRSTNIPAEFEYELDIGSEKRSFEARVVQFPQNQLLIISRDITEKVRAEQERQRSESHLKLVMEQLPIVVWMFDEHLKLTSVMGKAMEYLGIVPTQLLGRGIVECVHGLDMDYGLVEPHRRALAGQSVSYDFKYRDSVLHCYIEPRRDAEGQIVGVIGVALDRTNFVAVESELRKKEYFVDRIAEASPHIIYVFDVEQRHTIYCNRQVAADLGYSPDEVIAMGDDFMMHLLHPDDLALISQLLTRWDSAKDGDILKTEYRLKHADGSLRWFMGRDTVFKRDDLGRVTQIIGTAQDITDRVLAEQYLHASREQLQAIFNADPACLKVVANDGTLLTINASGLRMLGVQSEADVIGHSIFDKIVPEHREMFQRMHEKVCSGQSADLIFEIFGPNNERHWMESRAVPLQYTKDGPVMHLGVTRDITDELRSQQTIAEQQAQLTHFSRLATMGQMLATISHEITQPLSAISNYAAASTLAAERSPQVDPRLPQFLKSITDQASRAGSILERLRGFLRRTDSLRQRADLRDVAHDSIELVRFQLQKRQVHVDFRADATPVWVSVDVVQIQQVMVNLITNACDAMLETPVEERKIDIACFRYQNQACVAVSDRGCGLAEDHQERLFQAFSTSKPTGMGLGLAICRDILKIHQGIIIGANRPDGGATFEFRLPISDV